MILRLETEHNLQGRRRMMWTADNRGFMVDRKYSLAALVKP